MKKTTDEFPVGSWIEKTVEFSIPESTRTIFSTNSLDKFKIWTPHTTFSFEGYVDQDKFLLNGSGYCCRIYFSYNNIKLPISPKFLYLKDNGKVCFDNELHYYSLIFENHKELKDWAVNMHFNSKHKKIFMLRDLNQLTLMKNYQEIFNRITERP
jgi:hypothetical protein